MKGAEAAALGADDTRVAAKPLAWGAAVTTRRTDEGNMTAGSKQPGG
jgi:hypothetical protein